MKNSNKNKQEIVSTTNLIDDFYDPSIEKRINSAKNIQTIGASLGKDRIRSQFIPFLQSLMDDQDQVLIAIIQNVQILGQLMGSGLGFTCLYPLFQQSIQHQNAKVRSLAIKKYVSIVGKSDLKKSQKMNLDSINHIVNFDFQQSKEAVAAIIANYLGQFSTQSQQKLINIYLTFVQSNSSTLKKFAAMYSSNLLKWININSTTILKIIDLLFKDKDQSYKIYLIDAIIQLAKQRNTNLLHPYFNMISYQFTWRIRYQLISKAQKLGQVMDQQSFKFFLTFIVKYINDIEPEIKSISCLKLKDIIKFVDPEDVINKIIPALKNTHQDTHVFVRNSLAQSLLFLCAPIGKKNTTQHILPKFLQFLKDQDQQVRITIFKHFNLICRQLGTETLSQSIIPAMNELITHQNWRIRAESIKIFLYFVQEGKQTYMNDKNIKLAVDYLRDKAFSVRKQAFQMMREICDILGNVWFEKNILPKLLQLFKATSYLQRQTALLVIQKLLPKLSPEAINKNVLQLILSTCNDQVSNVRMCGCRVSGSLYPFSQKQKETILKKIKALKEDKDNDVKSMAIQTENKLIK